MKPDVRAYARMLRSLLPPGRLWRQDGDSTLSRVLLAAAEELVRVGQRAADLLLESDPRTATETLTDYEETLALGGGGSIAARRARIVAALIRRQRFRPVDFQRALAPLLGQAPEDVVVLETIRADAAAMGDDREIYRFSIYRSPAAPGSYDVEAAQALVDKMKPSHTAGYVVESIGFRCDDPYSLCDRDLLGV